MLHAQLYLLLVMRELQAVKVSVCLAKDLKKKSFFLS